MSMELSSFPQNPMNAADYTNFRAAAGRVGLLTGGLWLALVPPVAVFAVAVSQNPVFEDGQWIWDFSARSGGHRYGAVLTGWFDGGLREGTFLNLEMMVTCTSCRVPTENYVWYTGRFNTDGTDGAWTFFSPEIDNADQSFIEIAYDVTDDTHKSLTFTNIRVDGHEDAGDIIEYRRDGDMGRVSVHDASATEDYLAEWTILGDGFLHVPGYNMGEPACWDENQVNTPCPAL